MKNLLFILIAALLASCNCPKCPDDNDNDYWEEEYNILKAEHDLLYESNDSLTYIISDLRNHLNVVVEYADNAFFHYKDSVIINDDLFYVSYENDTFRIHYTEEDGYYTYYKAKMQFRDTTINRSGIDFCTERIERVVSYINGEPNYFYIPVNLCELENPYNTTLYITAKSYNDYEEKKLIQVDINGDLYRTIDLSHDEYQYEIPINMELSDIHKIKIINISDSRETNNDLVGEVGPDLLDSTIHVKVFNIVGGFNILFTPTRVQLDGQSYWNNNKTAVYIRPGGSLTVQF